ncbi:MAG: aminotransferase class I/II-fold pyridoxal phosphate-dependent enzyme [Gammaproteobacteria bacterium]|jgi:sphinganine-1-phosphate aldolase|nr:aminotransferase class I/II-fold pyridoxal phosphate-dependent enzyme [Gammaproteobacteria bacterium]MBT5602215.1 aminotransferase class I/II-fold pyridoxal phosphate-dependent enzyme [Gammaproteobacteria bacterium]MBT6246030.1 aminotransferase class I/II-fold pyridoxal phosphate-dependent enzyme [Gammaproteobacteria bacterium]
MVTDRYAMPVIGESYEKVLQQVKDLKAQMTQGQRGKLASTTFQGHEEMAQLTHEAFNEFMEWNGLFTFQEAAAAKMEDEVLDICISLMQGDEDSSANLTSGGTESNFNAFHAMRKWARETKPSISQPEVVAPYSTHSTVHKTCQYLDIKVVTVAQNPDLSCDMSGLEAAIGENTIGIVGSAPNWPYGQVDPIAEMGALALSKDLWLHVDACVGGYILPHFRKLGVNFPDFDFSVPGVRSISADLHKYGYAPKPCSTVLWRSRDEYRYHYMPITEWACGLYLSQGFVGSRTLGPVAGIWALMHYWGEQGYLRNAQRILDVKNAIISQCAAIEGLQTWPTDGPLLMIASDQFDIQLLVGGMEERGWRLLGVTSPPAIHLTLDVMEQEYLSRFLEDLQELSEDIQNGKVTKEGLLSYGGVGAGNTAPKWLLKAVEVLNERSAQ